MRDYLKHLLAAVLICCAIYLPTLLMPYERHDDYFFANYQMGKECRATDLYAGSLGYGRILMAEMLACVLHPVYQQFPYTQTFVVFRLIDLGLVILAFSMLSFWITRVSGAVPAVGYSFATLLFTLPGFQYTLAQSLLLSNVYAVPLAVLAVLALRDWRIVHKELSYKPWHFSSWGLTALLLLIALFTYQVYALTFLVPALFILVLGNVAWEERRIIVLRHLVIFGITAAVYLLLQKMVVVPTYLYFFPNTEFGGYGEMAKSVDLASIVKNIIHNLYVPKATVLWFIPSSEFLEGKFILAFIGISLIAGVSKGALDARKEGRLKGFLWRCLQVTVLAAVLFLGLMAHQIVYKPIWYFRTLIFYSLFIAVWMIWSAYFWVNLVAPKVIIKAKVVIIVALAMIVGAWSQQSTYRYFAGISVAETNFLEASIHPLLTGEASVAMIIRPKGNVYFEGDEHGMLTSCFDNTYGLPGIVRRIYQRNNRDPKNLAFEISPETRRIVAIIDKSLMDKGVTRQIEINMDIIYKILLLSYK